MEYFLLKFYVHEGDRHHGRQLWEWLLEQGNRERQQEQKNDQCHGDFLQFRWERGKPVIYVSTRDMRNLRLKLAKFSVIVGVWRPA